MRQRRRTRVRDPVDFGPWLFSGVSAGVGGSPAGIPCLDPVNIPTREVAARHESTVNHSELGSELHARGAVVGYHGPMVHGNIETEAKWRADEREHERLRAVLRRAGASHIGTVLEINTRFASVDAG